MSEEIKTLTRSEFARKVGITVDRLCYKLKEDPSLLETRPKDHHLIVDSEENIAIAKEWIHIPVGRTPKLPLPRNWFALQENKQAVLLRFQALTKVSIPDIEIWLTTPKESKLPADSRHALKKAYKEIFNTP